METKPVSNRMLSLLVPTAMKTPVKSIDEYIAGFPKDTRALLTQIRTTIRQAAPDAEEVISYSMPAYKYNGMLVFFAAFKNHIGFYATPTGHKAFKKELSVYKEGKGSVQFPLNNPLPLGLITKIVKFRVKENLEKAKSKKSIKPTVKAIKSKKPSDEEQVNAWLNKLTPKVKIEINTVRKIIKDVSPKLSERIKWNAPSYYYLQDILTFGPYKSDKILLVFHHPAVVNIKSLLLKGEYKDRRLVYFNNKTEAEKNKKELSRIINKIVKSIDKK